MIPDISTLEQAAERIKPHAVITPLLECPIINKQFDTRLLVKAEPLQRTGSFKFRGACNRLLQLDKEQRVRGVVAYSSGNHAQAVAYAASLLDTPAVIVMPADAPAVKIERTRGYGADVVLYDRYTESREAIGQALAAERNLVLIPPYDDADVISGQGTTGLEIAWQAAQLGASLDALLVCCSGGGLVAGCALAMQDRSPATAVYCVEPQGYDDTTQSLAQGQRVSVATSTPSICDALLVPTPGVLTFSINQRLLAGGLVVSDDEACAAMRVLFDNYNVVAEPGGAVAMAAALQQRLDVKGKTIGVVCSGGNTDAAMFAKALKPGE